MSWINEQVSIQFCTIQIILTVVTSCNSSLHTYWETCLHLKSAHPATQCRLPHNASYHTTLATTKRQLPHNTGYHTTPATTQCWYHITNCRQLHNALYKNPKPSQTRFLTKHRDYFHRNGCASRDIHVHKVYQTTWTSHAYLWNEYTTWKSIFPFLFSSCKALQG